MDRRRLERAMVMFDMLDDARRRHGAAAVERLEAFLETPRGSASEGARFPGLTSRPWHDPADHPACRALEAGAGDILRELEAALARREGFQSFRQEREHFVPAEHWKTMYFFAAGHRIEANRLASPRTAEVLDEISNVFSMAMVSALLPGGHIRPHRGPSNCRITLHLGLIVPPGCTLRVDDESRSWEPGRCLAFDDTFEHEAHNPSDRTRFVVYVDVWHPELSRVEVEFLRRAQAAFAPPEHPQALERLLADRHDACGHPWWA